MADCSLNAQLTYVFPSRGDTGGQTHTTWWPQPHTCEMGKNGGAKRDRTADLLHAMQALSQLSYGPTLCTGLGPGAEGAEQ